MTATAMIPAVRKPSPVRPGDRVRIVSPASPLDEATVRQGMRLLEERGYLVDLGPHALLSSGYLAGPDELRARDLQEAFLDPEIKAVFCSRGGYGTSRILPMLDLDAMAASRTLFLGYSDVTVLHLALNRRGLPSVYAPMPITLSSPKEPWVYESLLRAFAGDTRVPDEAPKAECVVPGVAEGIVVGGTLCLLTDAIATPEEMDLEGKIVMIEDVDEYNYRVDAMLTHLLNAGRIQKAAGIVVGEMTRSDSKIEPSIDGWKWKDVVRDRLAPLGIPMVWDYPFGHNRAMLSVPMGIRARLDAEAGTLEYLEPLCED